MFSWLDYDENKDVVFCHFCRMADKNQQLNVPSKEPTFIKSGFSNWKDALNKFRSHERSACHHVAIDSIRPTTKDVAEMLSKGHEEEKKCNRRMLIRILKAIRLLGRQGLPLRGDSDEKNCNFIQTLKTIGSEEEIIKWLEQKANKYTSPDIQNEILKIMVLNLLQNVVSKIDGFFTIMCDECTDSSNREQLVICLRWVDKSCLEVHEDFIGLYSIPDIAAGTILGVIKDTLSRLNLGFNRCRGQCYDGASNMSGHKSGIAKSITDIESRALYTHCYGHSLNLAVGNTIKNIKILTDVMDIIHEMSALIKFSPKQKE